VHLGQDDLPVAEVRRLLRPGAIVGRSSHNLAQARAAVNEGADYVSVGPIFDTATKDAGAPVGTELLKIICGEVNLPVVAVGGIKAENVSQLVKAGAKTVAVCSGVCSANPAVAAEAIKKQLP